MTRRDLLQGVGAGAAALALPACARGAQSRGAIAPEEDALLRALGAERNRILSLAARAPSSHNAQPWEVRVASPDRWIVGADPARRLPIVDAQDRELVLSIGTFLEYLVVGAAEAGWDAGLTVTGGERVADALVEVQLHRAPGGPRSGEVAAQIDRRRTLRKHYLDTALQPADLEALLQALGPRARWFPRGSPEGDRLAEWASASFAQQTWNDAAQRELSRWIRLGGGRCAEADGLTPDTMEVGGLSGFYVRHFMGQGSVMGKAFRQSGIDLTKEQALQGAGWLALDSPDEGVPALLEAGRRFARMALRLRERRLAAHPMSQMLEEEPWRSTIGRDLRLEGPAQLVMRVGYVRRYGDPVSCRRAVGAFTTMGGE
jgi:hypothetical protein